MLIPKIIQYIKCAAQWHALGEPTPIEDGPGLEMSELEEEILRSFGLPATAYRYSNIKQQFGFDDEDAELHAHILYARLTKEAETYLLSPAKSSTEIVRECKKNWSISQDAMAFLGFENTRYAGFLYHDIYLKGICTETELIQHLQFVHTYSL